MKLIKTKLAAATLLVMIGQGVANADSLAYSELNISNFRWNVTSTGTQLTNVPSATGPYVTITSGNNFGALTGSLGGGGFNSPSSSLVSTGGQIPFHSAGCDTVSCSNAAAPSGPTAPPIPTSTFVMGSNSLTGAIFGIDTSNPPDGTVDVGAGGANATSISESSLVSNVTPNIALGNTSLGTNTSIGFTVGGSPAGTILGTTFTLDYLAKAIANVIAPSGAGDVATSGIQWNLTLLNQTTGTQVLNWLPGDLNHTSQTNAVNGLDSFVRCSISVAGCIGTGSPLTASVNLVAGNSYVIGITHQIQTNVTRDVQVPEPVSLSLLGLGLLGFGLTRRKNAKMMAA